LCALILKQYVETISENTWLAIINPNAGVGKCSKDWEKISGLLISHSIEYQAVFTKKRLHATELTRQYIEKGFRKFIAIGGDGTLNEVVNGILEQKKVASQDITIAVISVGTGNDWIRTFNIPLDYSHAIALIKKQDTFLQDAGRVTYMGSEGQSLTRYFINMAGLGFDGLVAQKTNADKDRGVGNALQYVKNIFLSLFAFKSVPTRIVTDGKEIQTKIFSIGVGIGKYNGGGMKQAPDAIPDDGLFAMTLIKDMTKWSVIANVRRLYDGSIGKHKKVEMLKGSNIYIEPQVPVLLEADGESLGTSPFTFTIIPKSLRVVINKQNMVTHLSDNI
jgi:YegS/Rv2252/BmrU family lipid kinase